MCAGVRVEVEGVTYELRGWSDTAERAICRAALAEKQALSTKAASRTITPAEVEFLHIVAGFDSETRPATRETDHYWWALDHGAPVALSNHQLVREELRLTLSYVIPERRKQGLGFRTREAIVRWHVENVEGLRRISVDARTEPARRVVERLIAAISDPTGDRLEWRVRGLSEDRLRIAHQRAVYWSILRERDGSLIPEGQLATPRHVWISYRRPPGNDASGRPMPGRYKRPPPDGVATVLLYRTEIASGEVLGPEHLGAHPPADWLAELITLAHELGHHESFLRGTYTEEDHARPEECYLEEIRAWTHARTILEEHGFEDWRSFEFQEREALEGYRVGLGLSYARAAELEGHARAHLEG